MPKCPQSAIVGLLILSSITAANPQDQTLRNWNRLHSAHFILYTAGDASDAVNAIDQLEAARAFVQLSLKFGHIPNFKVTVIAFDGRQDFSLYEPHPNTFACYRRHRGGNYIVVKSMHGGPLRALAHEYIHAVFANIAPKLPLWLAEGLAEVYSENRKNGDTMSFGLAIADHIARLKAMPPGTVGTILKATPESAYADPSRAWDFYALSWSAVHTLATEPKYSGKLADFILAMNETGTEHALRTVYAVSTAEFASDVERHTNRALWQPVGRPIAWRATASYSLDVVPEFDVAAVLAHARQTDSSEHIPMKNAMQRFGP